MNELKIYDLHWNYYSKLKQESVLIIISLLILLTVNFDLWLFIALVDKQLNLKLVKNFTTFHSTAEK